MFGIMQYRRHIVLLIEYYNLVLDIIIYTKQP